MYRFAVSSTTFPLGQHPLVTRLLKGVFNVKPPQPKYNGTWDVPQVTSYLESLGESDALSIPLLTKKLAMPLALVSAQRSSDLGRLCLPVTRTSSGVSISLAGLAKQLRPGNTTGMTTSWVSEFHTEQKLCPVRCLREYLAHAEEWRKGHSRSQLFLAITAPHGPSTIAG